MSGIGMISTISIHAPGIICQCGWSLWLDQHWTLS
jgi:hypothetical protein